MKINPKEFCYLSQSEVFLDWLYSISPPLHAGLVDHLKKGLGCGSNKQAMLNLLKTITENSIWVSSISNFLRDNFPAIIVEDDIKIINKHGVFDYYDPMLATYPRRMIILDESGNLKEAVLSFCAKHGYCDYVIVEDRAYIEYLPQELLSIKNDIPSQNWQVKIYKAKNA